MARAGTPFVALFDAVDRATSALPDRIAEFIERLAAIELQTTRSGGAVFYHGRVQLDPTAGGRLGDPIDLGFGELRIPALAEGIRFQLALPRQAPAGTEAQDLEPAPTTWRLDLVLEVFDLGIDGLRPARYVPETSTMPRHLVRDPVVAAVRISGSAVLRLEKPSATAEVTARLIDQPDPLDPLSLSGFVASVAFTPPHFFIGGSQFALTVGRLLYDASESYTPPEIVERGRPAAWTGLLIGEATLYAPRNAPGLGDISGGVKDLLISRPMGIQGELEIQFGRSALDPATFQFEQVTDGTATGLTVSGSGRSRTVQITGGQEHAVEIRAGLNAPAPATLEDGRVQEWTASWRWAGAPAEVGDDSAGNVRHGQVLHVTPIEELTASGGGTEAINHPEVVFRFVSAGTAPTISAAVGSGSFDNLVHLTGTRSALQDVTLSAVDGGGGGSFEWRLEKQDARTQGATFTPQLGELGGEQMIVLTQKVSDDDQRTARVKLSILDEGELLFGTENGVFAATDDTAALALAAVENTYDLTSFHTEGRLATTRAQASLTASAPFVAVPGDALAQVTIAPPAAPAPPEPPRDRVVEVLMAFDQPKPDAQGNPVIGWGARKPAGLEGASAFSQQQLLSWAARYPGAQFLVVGRCGDLGSASYNKSLAERRAIYVTEQLLTRWSGGPGVSAVDPGQVFSRGEQTAWSSTTPDTLEDDSTVGLSAEERSDVLPPAEQGWLIRQRPDYDPSDHVNWPPQPTPGHPSETIRGQYRRVDVIAVGGTPTTASERPDDTRTTGAQLRRSYVPAPGRAPAPAEVGTPGTDYRVKLRIVWDSPTVATWYDAVPTLAEAELVWTPTEMPLPAVDGEQVALSRETFTVHAQWLHDVRTGYTKLTMGLKSEGDEDGLFAIENDAITAALALGPALLSGMDFDSDLVGSGARLSALLAAAAFAEVPIPPDNRPLLADASKTAVKGFAVEAEMAALDHVGADAQYRLVFDYVCELHVDAGVLGLRTAAGKPVKIRYKRVGAEIDTSQTGWDQFGLVYDTKALEIEDPGKWQISGVLGELLRITEITMGRGSFWIEGTVAFGLSIGVVEITEATIRLTWNDGSPIPNFELRGFAARVDIPAVLKGEGRLRIGDGGEVRAGVECEVIPPQISASAALAFASKTAPEPYLFLSLHVGVQFATPLPLGQSGLAIYGLKGMFTMNGERALPANPDPIARELAWFAANPEDKYNPRLGQYALGFGAVVGTMPDVSFCFSCEGMLAVGFPDPEVIFGVKVKIIEVPDTAVSDQGAASAAITGLIVIDDEAVKVGVVAEYEIPKVVFIRAPFSAYFPYPDSPGNVYVRIGSDGVLGRHGEPITATLLPGTLDVKAWAYLMIEQDGLPSLGGDARFNFDGFAVGFGAGWGIDWRAGPIQLTASAKVLVGLGTDPLMIKGGVFVAGELSLVVVSVSARGELILTIRETFPGESDVYVRLDGKFCGKVDMFFFSIEGCVGVSIGSELSLDPPVPKSPVEAISLTDRSDRVMGTTTKGTPQANPISPPLPESDSVTEDGIPAPAAAAENHTVWPDTAPIIHFGHYVEDNLPGSSQFAPGPPPSQPKWFGASELKYAYRLDNVILRRHGGALLAGTLNSVWTTTPYRQPDSGGGVTPSEHEGPNLKLLDWNPWNWVLNLPNGGAGQEGDPVDTVDELCDPAPVPQPLCLYGRDAVRAGLYRMRIHAPPVVPGPYASRYRLTGEAVVGTGSDAYRGEALHGLIGAMGGLVLPGAVVDLTLPVTVHGVSLARAYRLPRARLTRASGLVDLPLPYEGRYSRALVQPELFLLVCDAANQARSGDQPGLDRDCDGFERVKPRDEGLRQLDRPRYSVAPIVSTESIVLVDEVDQRGDPAQPGRDGDGEVRIPPGGLRIRLKHPCRAMEVHVMLFANAPIKATAMDGAGNLVDTDSTSRTQRTPLLLEFAARDIAELQLFGGGGEAVVFRICCVDRTPHREACESFENLRPRGAIGTRLNHAGLVFTTADRASELRLVDMVDQSGGAARAGRDGSAEILLPDNGLSIDLPRPCDAVDVHVMLFASQVTGVALNAAGAEVARDQSGREQHRPYVLHFEAAGITRIRLEGGQSEGVLYRICCAANTGDAGVVDSTVSAETRLANSLLDGLPMVQGEEYADGDRIAWPGEVVSEHRGRDGPCRLIAYRPRGAAGSWRGFRIVSPPGRIVFLVAHCGIEQRVVDARDDDIGHQADTAATLKDAAATPADERRTILLDPNTEYEVEVQWSWQAWQPEDEGDEPPATPAGSWTAGTPDIHRFRTAPAAGPLGDIQDGLNEHVFDARDLARYLIGTEPSGTRAAHFTDDPLWAHFSAGHVAQLADVYGRTLEIEVRRTDPPPASGVSLMDLLLPVGLTMRWRDPARHHLPVGYRRLNEAIDAAPCVPGRGPLGGASAEIDADLAPDAGYDLIILAVDAAATGHERIQVARTHFRTSRYANPAAMLAAMGYDTVGRAPLPPDDYILPEGTSLPSGALEVGDVAVDTALAGIELDTLPPPTGNPRNLLLWQLSGAAWQVVGLLVDSLEPLKRQVSIKDADGVPDLATRLELTAAEISGGHTLTLRRVNSAWTRALLTPASPVPLSAGSEYDLTLVLAASGGALRATRRITGRPSVLDREGL